MVKCLTSMGEDLSSVLSTALPKPRQNWFAKWGVSAAVVWMCPLKVPLWKPSNQIHMLMVFTGGPLGGPQGQRTAYRVRVQEEQGFATPGRVPGWLFVAALSSLQGHEPGEPLLFISHPAHGIHVQQCKTYPDSIS